MDIMEGRMKTWISDEDLGKINSKDLKELVKRCNQEIGDRYRDRYYSEYIRKDQFFTCESFQFGKNKTYTKKELDKIRKEKN